MPRTKNVNGVDIQLTDEEETQRDAEIAQALTDKVAFQALQWERDRRAAYPPIGDQLDGILKQMNQDRLGGKAMIQDADNILAAWLGVKATHPKPE